jgi:hypothetical protein
VVKAPRETDLVKACLQLLKLHGVPCWRNNCGAARYTNAAGRPRLVRFGAVGSSDILGVLPPEGRLLAIEVKGRTGKLTPTQAAFLDNVRAAGGLALVVRDVRDLQRALELEGAARVAAPGVDAPGGRRV